MKYFLIGLPSMGIFLSIAQLPPPRQVSIGGMILPRQTLQDLEPRAQIPNSQPLKSALKQSTDYSYMIDSPLQALFVDTCIACSLCATGMCATCTLCPQLSPVAHFTTNSIVCSCVLGYWLTDQEEVFKNAQIKAGKDLISHLKTKIYSITRSILAYDEEKKHN